MYHAPLRVKTKRMAASSGDNARLWFPTAGDRGNSETACRPVDARAFAVHAGQCWPRISRPRSPGSAASPRRTCGGYGGSTPSTPRTSETSHGPCENWTDQRSRRPSPTSPGAQLPARREARRPLGPPPSPSRTAGRGRPCRSRKAWNSSVAFPWTWLVNSQLFPSIALTLNS
jgi:hypothetical protein